MRTVDEILRYVDKKDLGRGLTKGWRRRHFEVAARQLNPGEEALTAFIGLHNYFSREVHDNYYAYLITNDRIIMTQKRLTGEDVKVVLKSQLNDIRKSNGIIMGTLTFKYLGEEFNVGIDRFTLNNIHNEVIRALFGDSSEVQQQVTHTSNITNTTEISAAQEIMEFKELLDLGIITQDEFDKKRSELLG